MSGGQRSVYLNPFEMKLAKCFDSYFSRGHFLLAVSGGKDSVALLHAWQRVASKRSIRLRCAYIHHGEGVEESDYRGQCFHLLVEQARARGIELVSNYPDKLPSQVLRSEAALRDYRYQQLESLKQEGEILVTAHHNEDLLETRLIRLIRGCSETGMQAMQEFDGRIFRPFLNFKLNEIEAYVASQQLIYCEDPSNSDTHYLRNFLRKQWLPALEQHRPGSKNSLAQSLDWLAETAPSAHWSRSYFSVQEGIHRQGFLCLSGKQKEQVLANYLYQKQCFDFRKSQISELARRLDTDQNEHQFKLIGHLWQIDEQRIAAHKY